jgi:iron complex transport system substrate-binding protein
MRKKAVSKTLLLLLIALTVVSTVAACRGDIYRLEQREVIAPVAQSLVLTKVIDHALGQAKIPLHPKRIVVLDDSLLLDPLLALGIKPVGFATCTVCLRESIPKQLIADIPTVGDSGAVSIEKILSLKPDLILGHRYQQAVYPLLSVIAPTVMIDSDAGIDFKRELRYVAGILDKSNEAEEILIRYEEQIQRFRQTLGNQLSTKTVSVIHMPNSTIFVYGPKLTIYGQIMKDAGLNLIPAYRELGSGYLRVSIETLTEWDADFLFIVVDRKRNSEDLKGLSFLKQPVWLALKSVQRKQVHPVVWDIAGPITANQFIDDLYKYFGNTPVGGSGEKMGG